MADEIMPDRATLLRRVASILRGDWSMTCFDGRNVKHWIDTALDGDPRELAELAKDLTDIEAGY
jgi:hypothetical protein